MGKRGPRPHFDRDEALRKAMLTFWEHGYEGTTIAQLKVAMGGIGAPSVYAAFTSKAALFREVVDLYEAENASLWQKVFDQPNTYSAIETLLRESVLFYTAPGHPRGCLLNLGVMDSTPENRNIQDYLRTRRQAYVERIRARLQRGLVDGDFDPNLNVNVLTDFYYSILLGLSTQASDGASQETLLSIVDVAMKAWPLRTREISL
jgi:AcrR family transcriptional regulator